MLRTIVSKRKVMVFSRCFRLAIQTPNYSRNRQQRDSFSSFRKTGANYAENSPERSMLNDSLACRDTSLIEEAEKHGRLQNISEDGDGHQRETKKVEENDPMVSAIRKGNIFSDSDDPDYQVKSLLDAKENF